MPPYSSTSGDELNVLLSQSLTEPKPDPYLGEFSASPPEGPPDAEAATLGEEPAHESFDAVAPVNAFTDPDPVNFVADATSPEAVLDSSPSVPANKETSDAEVWPSPQDLAIGELGSGEVPANPANTSSFDVFAPTAPVGPPPQPASFDAFPSLDLNAPTATSTPEASKKVESEEEDDDEDDEAPSRGSSLLTFMLLSYASAVTIGLAWVLFTGRRLHESEDDLAPTAEAKPDPGRRADQSRKVTPPSPLASDHITSLGKTLKFAGLEITPLEIRSKPVRLRRALAPKESRAGGSKALWLKLRLRNVTKDTIFAPLDEAFLREREHDVLDSLIESADGSQIVMYPLAVSSEWVVDGQEFKELRPGESFDAWVVSASESSDRLPSELTWRVRLRTGIEQTETIGVRFRPADIR